MAIPTPDVLQQQTQLTANELRAQAEQLRAQALQASAKLTSTILSEEERTVLIRRSSEALVSAAEIVKAQTEAASSNLSTLLQVRLPRKQVLLFTNRSCCSQRSLLALGVAHLKT